MFDIWQTEGDEFPTGQYELPAGDGPDGALAQLTAWLEREGWTVREEQPQAGKVTPSTASA